MAGSFVGLVRSLNLTITICFDAGTKRSTSGEAKPKKEKVVTGLDMFKEKTLYLSGVHC
jgi:hypothetical protein